MKKITFGRIVCALLSGVLVAGAAEPGADQLRKPAETKETKKPVAKRLTPAERKALFIKLQERQPSDPEVLRKLTDSAPRKVVGGKARVAERVNNALNAEQPSRGTPFPR